MIGARGRPEHFVSAVSPNIDRRPKARNARRIFRVERPPSAIIRALPNSNPERRPLNSKCAAPAVMADDLPRSAAQTGAAPKNWTQRKSERLRSGRAAPAALLRGAGR
jgi:hypothetical protein